MVNDDEDEVTKELFDSLKNKHQNNLESKKYSELVFMFIYCIKNVIK